MLLKFSLVLLVLLFLFSCNSTIKKEETNFPDDPSSTPINKGYGSTEELSQGLQIFSPAKNEIISSPLTIKGRAKGHWYFEAVFSVKLIDGDYKVLSESYVRATENWMTNDWVPFKGVMEFTAPKSSKGFIIFEKANPSGLAEKVLTDTLQIFFRR